MSFVSDGMHRSTAVALLAGGAVGAGIALGATAYMLSRDSSSSHPGNGSKSSTLGHHHHEFGQPSAWQRVIQLLNGGDYAQNDPLKSAFQLEDAAQRAGSAAIARHQAAAHAAQPSGVADTSGHAAATCSHGASWEDDEVLAEHFTRNRQFFGRDSQSHVAAAFVVVVGLGGVGSHAAAMLLRSGVSQMRLIDFDQVTLSSLNRHAVATRADVGLPKATVLASHFREICPEAKVEPLVEMYTAEAEDALLAGQPDFVLDAIDNIDTKVALLAACKRRGIPVLCCAGAGAKADPTRIRIADIGESSADPLARAVRHRLRQLHGIDRGVQVLLSSEKPRCRLVDNTGGGNLSDFQVVPNFRVRTIPVLGTTPAIFGQAAAAYILCQLAQQPLHPEPLFRILPAAITAQLDRLRDREELRFGTTAGVLVDADEIGVLVREVWRGLSARALAAGDLPAMDKGLNRRLDNLTFTRWDATKPADVDNLLLLTFDEAEAHEAAEGIASLRQREPKFATFVEAKLDRVRREFYM